jgi:ppGpp synthetase/RelA/SpoT-type nucleotidyltranferase
MGVNPQYSVAEQLQAECEVAAFRAQQVHQWLKPLLANSPAATSAYTFKDRLKPFHEIKAKVVGKRGHENPRLRKLNYSPRDVSDASGFRIVCLFNAEIPVALNNLFDLIALPGDRNAGGRFERDAVREVIFYSSRRNDDPLSILDAVRMVVDEHRHTDVFDVPSAPEGQKGSSYSSVHVVVRAVIEAPGVEPIVASSEIQVRSVFEEAWGEINHRLLYAPRKRARSIGNALDQDAEEKTLLAHLDALKSLTDGCAQYADLINTQLGMLRSAMDLPHPKIVDPPEEMLKPFAVVGERRRAVIQAAFDCKSKAEASNEVGPDREALFAEAAARFEEAIRALDSGAKHLERGVHERLSSILFEQLAYCYMYGGGSDRLGRAESLFELLLRGDLENVDVALRLAQIKRVKGDFVKAQQLMDDALTTVERQGESGKFWPKLSLILRDLAYVCWYLVRIDPRRSDAVVLLERAVELSKAALDSALSPAAELSTSLNLLYYYTDLYRHMALDPSRGEEKDRLLSQGGELLVAMRRNLDIESSSVEKLDTLLRGERTFGNPPERVTELATLQLERLRGRIVEKGGHPAGGLRNFQVLSDEEQDMYLYAQESLLALLHPQ